VHILKLYVIFFVPSYFNFSSIPFSPSSSYGLDGRGESSQELGIFLFTTASHPAYDSVGIRGAFSGGKAAGA